MYLERTNISLAEELASEENKLLGKNTFSSFYQSKKERKP